MVVMVAGACTSDDGDTPDDTSSSAQDVTSSNRIAMNSLSQSRLELFRISNDAIGGQRLGPGRYQLSATAETMLDSDVKRDVFTFVVGCALDKSTTLVGTAADGTQYEFPGQIGLAKSWLHHPIGDSDQHWVSSCLLSRVNAHAIELLISLRGPDQALTETHEEARDYTVEEGAFFGQVFVGDTDPILAYACMGRDQAKGEPASGPLHDRDCTEPTAPGSDVTQCGMTFVGNCADFAADDDDHDHGHGWGWGHDGEHHHGGGWWGHHDDTSAPHACEGQSWTGYYTGCHTALSDDHGRFPRHTLADEAITVYLTP